MSHMDKRYITAALITLLLVVSASPAATQGSATTHYVSTTGELEAAFQNAADGDTIVIAAGTYYPQDILKIGDRSLSIRGEGSGSTIIDGTRVANKGKDYLLGRDDTSEVVVDYIGIAGLTVRNYETEGIEVGKTRTLDLSDVVVRGCDDGFHIYVYEVDDARATIATCTAYVNGNDGILLMIENSAYAAVTIEGCRSYGNVDDGIQIDIENSAYAAVTIEGCLLHDNDDHGLSIPVTASDAASVTVEGCHAYGNKDAGFYFNTENSSDVSARYDRCIARDNAEEGFDINATASPVFSLALVNALSYGNAYGIALDLDGSLDNELPDTNDTISVTNCTVYGNEYGLEASSPSATGIFVTNGIFWNNSSEISVVAGTIAVTYSDVQGGYPGTGSMNADPLFVDAPADFSLSQSSPCINTGANASAGRYGGVTDDIIGIVRPQHARYDMGAYEYDGAWMPDLNPPAVHPWLAFVITQWENRLDMLLRS